MNKSGILKIFLFILLFINCRVHSSPFHPLKFDQVTLEDGLSQSSVYDIVQDEKGFLWIGTDNGLNRYDGEHFKIFTPDKFNPYSISNERIFSAGKDCYGFLWFGTENGLNRYDPETGKFFHYFNDPSDSATLDDNSVINIFEDNEGFLWISTYAGLNRYIRGEDKFKRIGISCGNREKVVPLRIYDIHQPAGQDSILYLASYGAGLIRFNKKDFSPVCFMPQPEEEPDYERNKFRAVVPLNERELLAGSLDGLYIFDMSTKKFGKRISFLNKSYPFSLNSVNDILVHPSGEIWIGSLNDGLVVLSPDLRVIYNYREDTKQIPEISCNIIYKLFLDNTGILWTGTASGGMNKYDQTMAKFNVIRKKGGTLNTLASDEIWEMIEDSNGNIWICTAEGLHETDRSFSKFKHYTGRNSGLSSNEVFTLLEYPEGILWIGARNGLNRYDIKRNKMKVYVHDPENPNSIAGGIVLQLYKDRENKLWIAAYSGLTKLDPETEKFTRFSYDEKDEYSLSSTSISSVFQSSDGKMWIGTDNGLNVIDEETGKIKKYFHDPDDPGSISHNRIYAVAEDQKGRIWIGTFGGGLNKFIPEEDKFIVYGEAQGLASNIIYSMEVDKKGDLWIGTNMGLARFNPGQEKFLVYTILDGLPGNEFNYNSSLLTKDGELFFGGVNGIVSFYPGNIVTNDKAPSTVITGMTIFNEKVDQFSGDIFDKDLPYVEEITLSYKDYVFTFEFAALNFSAPEKNKFMYKMSGFNKEWINIGTRNFATFSNLSPGEYLFQVKGANNDYLWDKKGASIKVIITPPFWDTWWAYTFYLLLFIFVVIGIIRFKTKNQERELALLRNADKLKSEFLAQMSHEIRSPVGVILNFSNLLQAELEDKLDEDLKGGFQSMSSAGRRIIRTIDMILNMSEIQTGTYDFRPVNIDIIENVLEKLYQEFYFSAKEKNLLLELKNDASDTEIFADEYTVNQIIVNLIDNAIKYTPEGKIILRVLNKNSHLIVEVEDTGIGIAAEYIPRLFDAFSQEEQGYKRKFEGNGLGLALVKKYCEMNNAKIEVESKKGVGTIFRVSFNGKHPDKEV